MLAMDSLVSIVTWAPFMALQFNPYILPFEKYKVGSVIASIIVLTNCFSTPLLYFIFNKDFRVSWCIAETHRCCSGLAPPRDFLFCPIVFLYASVVAD